MFKIIQITDIHLVRPGKLLWGLNPTERLEKCLHDIKEFHADANFCVISGDLTDNGDLAAFKHLRSLLEMFEIDTNLMIGNHDKREVFFEAFPNHQKDDTGFIQYEIDNAIGKFLFLDTKKDKPVSHGTLCDKRLKWLDQKLTEAEGYVYIFMHHPPFDIGVDYMDRIKLDAANAFEEIVMKHQNVRHIFFGHVHRPVFLSWNGITCSACPGISHQVPIKRESVGTDYSIEPAMYSIIEIDNNCVRVNLDAFIDRFPTQMSSYR